MFLVEGTYHVIHSVVMVLFLIQRNVRWEGQDVMRHVIVVMVGIVGMVMFHVIQNVGMELLLGRRSVREEGADAIMNANARMDGNPWGMCHVFLCVVMVMLWVQRNVR